ncbi:MAG: hypothetical protein JWQ01_4549 [Massilia sp.]|nr:hypothetical protein [Massilia sp.]
MITRTVGTLLATAAIFSAPAAQAQVKNNAGGWQSEFGIKSCKLEATGRNPYLVLEPGYQLQLEGGDTKLQITVLDDTKTVDGVVTRVVEEREWKDGKLSEIARNYFAICPQTKDVFYFGEDVDFYENGKVVKHDGSWLAGNGNRAGLFMSGSPKSGMKYYQELAPKVAMDRAEIVSVNDTCKTPAGTFANCLKIKEGSAIETAAVEYKYFAPSIGLVGDDTLRLTRHGPAKNQQADR